MRLSEPDRLERDFVTPTEPCTCPLCLRRINRPKGNNPATGRPWLCFHCVFPGGRIAITADGRLVAVTDVAVPDRAIAPEPLP